MVIIIIISLPFSTTIQNLLLSSVVCCAVLSSCYGFHNKNWTQQRIPNDSPWYRGQWLIRREYCNQARRTGQWNAQ